MMYFSNGCNATCQAVMLQQLTLSEESTNSKYAEEFEEIERIGKGGGGSVYKCKKKLDEKLYAIKKIKCPNAEDWERAQSEVKVLANLDHKRIVRYHTSWWEPGLIRRSDSEVTGSQETEDYDVTSESDASPKPGNTGDADSKDSMAMSLTDESNDATENEHDKDISDDVEAHVGRTGILYIQMELCGMTLKDWINIRNSSFDGEDEFLTCLSKGEGLMIFRAILQGVECIHDQGLIHRDLKPLNVFMVENGHVKVGDLGLVTNDIFNDTVASPAKNGLAFDVKKGTKHTSGVGTPTYSAPEQLKGTKYTNKADIYSLGVILFELYQKFDTDMERYKVIENLTKGIISESMSECWPVQTEYIRKMTSLDPEKRPNVQDILADRELFLSKSHIIEDLKEEREVYTVMIKRHDASLKKMKRKLGQKKKAVEQMREESGEHAIEILHLKRKIKQKDEFWKEAFDEMVESEAIKRLQAKEAEYIAQIQRLKELLSKKNIALKNKDKMLKSLKEEVLAMANVHL